MAACISAGQHPNLIAVRGKIAGHPAGAEGLVLELIDPVFGNLAGPPSLASCTRDVYAPSVRLEVRAFGCLLEELLAHCPEIGAVPPVHQTWYELAQRCMQPEAAHRPLFAEIERVLAQVAVPQ
uniref:Leucine-rich repeat-containing protein 2, lrrc2, putative n=1 Tax=Tanacetum cinerariifolium TaxID=118510 RepID=A0A699TP96_TANCI|nr:leucine-rich repeat-containing protein 2, lrrc2, putative [Tanacetum cinerariifolium]